MSSHTSSAGYVGRDSSNYSDVVSRNTFRSHKSENHQGERIERESHSGRSVIYNHKARGYDKDAPSPRYGDSSSYGK
ncbi:hypothetical protein F4859DRAFT_519394 [Xylaria cf. heliscus]|nr:hypothetical protein F4859DRAFT_519394 [Xylaria cf. heliscus]